MQQGGLLLHLLQRGHAFLRHAQGFAGVSLNGRGRGGELLRLGGALKAKLAPRGLRGRAGRAVIGPGQFYGQFGDFPVGVPGAGLAAFPGGQVHGAAQRGQARQGAGQVGHAVLFAGGSVQRESGVLLAGQYGGGHAGQAGAGAHLQEYSYAVGVHLFHHSGEFHRGGQLGGQRLAGLVGGLGVSGGAFVGVDGGLRLVELYLGEGGGEVLLRAGHEPAVEGRGDLQHGALEAAGGQPLGGARYLGGGAGQHELSRGILVSYDQVQLLFPDGFLHFGQRGLHGYHAAPVAGAGGHQGAAQLGEREEVGVGVDAGRAQGRQFAVAVAGESGGFEAEGGQGAPGAQFGGAEGGLRHAGILQIFGLALLALWSEGGAGIEIVGERLIPAELRVGRGENVQRLGEAAGEVALHAGVLRALAGEQHCQFFRSGRRVINAVGRGPGGGFLRVQVGERRGDGLLPVGIPLQREAEAGGGGGLEGGAGARGGQAHSVPVQALPGGQSLL